MAGATVRYSSLPKYFVRFFTMTSNSSSEARALVGHVIDLVVPFFAR